MIGGIVVEVAEIKDRPDVLYIDCRDNVYIRETCGILVQKNEISNQIQLGDKIWWQGRWAMWTPANTHRGKQGVDFDIQIPRIGYSGMQHPDRC